MALTGDRSERSRDRTVRLEKTQDEKERAPKGVRTPLEHVAAGQACQGTTRNQGHVRG